MNDYITTYQVNGVEITKIDYAAKYERLTDIKIDLEFRIENQHIRVHVKQYTDRPVEITWGGRTTENLQDLKDYTVLLNHVYEVVAELGSK